MPTWPTTPTPYSVSPYSIIDPVLRFESDQGYSVRRSRWSRSRRQYQLTYLNQSDELMPILDFVERQIRGGALSFDWTYPYGADIAEITTATPNVVLMTWAHGLQTGDMVVLAGTVAHDGTYAITRLNSTDFSLDGTSGGSAEIFNGTAAAHFPFMALQLENDTMPSPEHNHDFGPLVDNRGLMRLALTLREEWA